MPVPAAHRAPPLTAPAPSPVSPGSRGPDINPITGLSTDYLNHFAEMIMVLEMSTASLECLDDLRRWQPKTYLEHFADSQFSNRDALIAAYQAATLPVRRAIDTSAEALNGALVEARDIALEPGRSETTGDLVACVARLKPLLTRIGGVINGSVADSDEPQGSQAEIDVLFKT